MANWKRVTKHNPCHGCGKPDFCRSADDGGIECKRGPFPGSYERLDKHGSPHWIGNINGSNGDGKQRELIEQAPAPEIAPIHYRDKVYRSILGQLGIHSRHYDNLRHRGFTQEAINRHGFSTLERFGRSDIARHVADLYSEWMAVPGLYVRTDKGSADRDHSRGDKSYPWIGGLAGMVIPCRDLLGRIAALRVRPDDPGEGGKYRWLSSANNGGPGPGAQCSYWAPATISEPGTIRITEGELKAARLAEGTGIPTISAPGAQSIGGDQAMEWVRESGVGQVLLCPDRDMKENPDVARAVRNAIDRLKALPVKLSIEVW